MDEKKKLKQLEYLYSRIPDAPTECMSCDGSCCRVPFMVSAFEKSRLPGNNFDATVYTPCVFNKDGKCSVYEKRPFLCRFYGAGRTAFCKNWETARPVMSEEDEMSLINDYIILFWKTGEYLANAHIRRNAINEAGL